MCPPFLYIFTFHLLSWVGGGVLAVVHMWTSEDDWQELVLSFHRESRS